MGLFRVPLSVTCQIPNCSVIAPDGTFIYISYSQIVFMSPQPNGVLDTTVLEAGFKVLGIDCDPDFARTRYVAGSYEDKHVYIWDLDKKAAVFGHSAHVEKSHQTKEKEYFDPLPVCFTLNKKVVSASKNRLVVYCVASNTFKVNTELCRKNQFIVLKASPFDSNLVAAGTKAGLVVIISLKNMTITHTMRGHDSDIRCLDWVKVPLVPVEEEDLFGLYSDNAQNEFGVLTESRINKTFDMDDVPTETKPSVENMTEEKFDFTEACQALKQDIIANKEYKPQTEIDFNDIENTKKPDSDSFSEVSDAPSRDNDFKSVEDEPTLATTNKVSDKTDTDLVLLLSTASEPRVWIWDSQKGCALDKIHLPSGNYKDGSKIRSFTAKWLNPYNILTNDQNGCLCLWDIDHNEDGKIEIHKSKMEFAARAVVHVSVDCNTSNFWTVSLFHNICRYNVDSKHPVYDYCCMNSNIYKFPVNPVDPNVVAFAGNKRISLLNVSKMSYRHFPLNYMNNKLYSQVLTLAWHPEKENVLAFGTREGQVGVFDTKKLHGAPFNMKPYYSKDVYAVTWGKFKAKEDEEMAWTLFCCGFRGNAGYLAYYLQQGNNKYAATEVKRYKNVTAVAASADYLAIGFYDGAVCITDLSDSTLTPFYNVSCGGKLITDFAFSNKNLAVACFDHQITILTIVSKEQTEIQHLKGHQSGVTNLNWSLTQPDILVSSSNDCTVRVWNTKEAKCEATAKFEREVFAANFLSKDQDTIIVGGHDFMVTIFDYKKDTIDYSRKIIKNGAKLQRVTMAVANEIDHGSKMKKEKRRNLEIQKQLEKIGDSEVKENGNGTVEQELVESLAEMKVEDKDEESSKIVKEKKLKEKTLNLNYSSIFFLTPRELNRDPIGLLQTLISKTSETSENRHEKLFSSNSSVVRDLLNEEHSHQIASNAQSVGHLSLPILTMDIKSVILEKISSKTLTEEYIAVAPFISHTFWRNACLAYAHQCVEQGLVLKAISYFLCCYEENEAIAILCQSHHFTEAMAIAKMRKSEEDPIFDEIAKKWTSYLEYCGNFEAASIVWLTYGKKDEALKVLERRANPSEELQEVIRKMKDENCCDELKDKDD